MKKEAVLTEQIAQSIYLLRGQKVMLDFDLATLYGVATKVLNQAVKRNKERFPSDFMFQLTAEEARSLRSQSVTLNQETPDDQRIGSTWSQTVTRHPTDRGVTHRLYAFTEQGVAMLSIRQLMAPPEKPKRELGFHVRETAPPYRTRKVR